MKKQVTYTLLLNGKLFKELTDKASELFGDTNKNPVLKPSHIGVTSNKNVIFVNSTDSETDSDGFVIQPLLVWNIKRLLSELDIDADKFKLVVSYGAGDQSVHGRLSDPEFKVSNVLVETTAEMRQIYEPGDIVEETLSADYLENFFRANCKDNDSSTIIRAKYGENIGISPVDKYNADIWVVINGVKYRLRADEQTMGLIEDKFEDAWLNMEQEK